VARALAEELKDQLRGAKVFLHGAIVLNHLPRALKNVTARRSRK